MDEDAPVRDCRRRCSKGLTLNPDEGPAQTGMKTGDTPHREGSLIGSNLGDLIRPMPCQGAGFLSAVLAPVRVNLSGAVVSTGVSANRADRQT